MQPRATQTDKQFAVFDPGVYVAHIEAEQAQETDEVRLHERDALQKPQLVLAHAQLAQALDLVANFVQVRAQVFAVTAAELPFDFHVGIVVQHRLHHGQFVEIGVEQVLHDVIGKHTLAHSGYLHAGRA